VATQTKHSQLNALGGFLIAVLTLPVIYGLVTFDYRVAYIIFVVAVFHAALAWPIFYLLNQFKRVNIWTSLLLGFSVGALPLGIVLFPHNQGPGNFSWMNGVDTMIDGAATLAGWIYYSQLVMLFGGFGCLSALAFWFCLSALSRNKVKT
jgi:hypothetical protein